MPEKMAVLDFGSQYTQTIARRLRELNIYTEILPAETPSGVLEGYKGIVLSGGPASVYDSDAPKADGGIWDLDAPKLCICYGMQLAAQNFSGKVLPGKRKEYGETNITIRKYNALLSGLEPEQTVWMSHGDSVVDPESIGFDVLAASSDNIVAAMANKRRGVYAVQFHPEVSHTKNGRRMLKNFAYDICGLHGDWTMDDYAKRARDEIREKVGNGSLVAFVSGGVDSTTAAYLAQDVLGDRLHVIYIDNGGVRKGENEWVLGQLKKLGFRNVVFADYSGAFMKKLLGTVDAEEKRKIIGNTFVDVKNEEFKRLGLDPEKTYLLQGTLYTDTIESGKGVGKKAAKIKTHHNLLMTGLVVEPMRHIFKDEVRRLARSVGLPSEISEREPFPGPGLYVRHIGNLGYPDDFEGLRNYVYEVTGHHNMCGDVFPIKTVGVQGDSRTYAAMAVITGDRDWQQIRDVTKEIIKGSDRKINRVAYRLKSPHWDITKEAENIMPMRLGTEGMDALREIDYIGRSEIQKDPSYKIVSQIPFNLFAGGWAGIRDFQTEDFMTGRPLDKPNEMSWDVLDRIADRIMENPELKSYGIRGVLLDTTDKPPATTEAE